MRKQSEKITALYCRLKDNFIGVPILLPVFFLNKNTVAIRLTFVIREKLYYCSTNNYKRHQAFFCCSAYRKNSDVCSVHYIREKIVVSKAEYIDGVRHQNIDIYYKGVGIIKFFSPEETEALYQKHINSKRSKEKTA